MIVVAGLGRPEVKKVEKIIDLDERRFALGAEHRVGRIFVRMCQSVEDNDRNALLIRLVYGWRDGDLSRCHHQQVHALSHSVLPIK